jgi:hypothetical protein
MDALLQWAVENRKLLATLAVVAAVMAEYAHIYFYD